MQSNKNSDRIFSGNIYIFHAFDVGEDINLDKIATSHEIILRPLVLPKYFKQYDVPLEIELPHPHSSAACDSVKIHNFGAISLNQIPNDENSIKGNNIRGVYWTKPDETGKEVTRDVGIDESKYTQLVPEFEDTYFAEVYETLKKNFKIGRIRILLKQPRSSLSWHRDPEPRLHIPIITNPGCMMVIENIAKHLPADGSVTITNNTKYHNFFNGGEQDRIHLVACMLEDRFN